MLNTGGESATSPRPPRQSPRGLRFFMISPAIIADIAKPFIRAAVRHVASEAVTAAATTAVTTGLKHANNKAAGTETRSVRELAADVARRAGHSAVRTAPTAAMAGAARHASTFDMESVPESHRGV